MTPFQLTSGNPSSVQLAPRATYGMGPGAAPGQISPLELLMQQRQQQFDRDRFDQTFPAQLASQAADRAAQLQVGMAPWQYKDKVFQTVSPLLQGLLGNGNSASGGLVGGQNTPQPQVDAAPVWSPQQVDRQVNAAKAGNAQSAATQQRAAADRVTGQGFGSRSPLLSALTTGIDQTRMGQDASADREIRWGAAEGNAQQVMKGQLANQAAWTDANKLDVERRKANNQYVTSLAGILGGLV